jgi:hypothetical protein
MLIFGYSMIHFWTFYFKAFKDNLKISTKLNQDTKNNKKKIEKFVDRF